MAPLERGARPRSADRSYGVVLVEILTGTPPYCHHESPVQCMVAVACHGERPRLPESMRQDEAGVRLGRLCDACTELEPRMRPGFGPIVEELTAVSALLTPPPPRTPGGSRSASPREPPLPRPPSGAAPLLLLKPDSDFCGHRSMHRTAERFSVFPSRPYYRASE